MKVALICTAKDEDNYIDEWIDYHFKLGIDDIFIYENQWNYNGKFKEYDSVHKIYLEHNTPQLVSFNHFVKKFYSQFDFGIFLDCDEYICLKKDNNIEAFLNNYKNDYGVGISTIIFGDNGITFDNKNYSCINRFTRRCKNPIREIKTILNFNICKDEPIFNCPHSIIQQNKILNANKTHFINGPFNAPVEEEISSIQINHYITKTFDEFKNKLIKRGWPDTPNRKYTEDDIEKIKGEFHNFYKGDSYENNEIEDSIVKDLYNKKYKIKVIQYDNRFPNEITLLAKEINEKYCSINGYDYSFESKDIDLNDYKEYLDFYENEHQAKIAFLMYQKYVYIEKYLNDYDYICYLDSDAVFVNPNIRIESLLNKRHDIFITQDCGMLASTFFVYSCFNQIYTYCQNNKLQYIKNFKEFSKNVKDEEGRSILQRLNTVSTNPNGLNSGFLLIKNSYKTKEFLSDYKKYHPIFGNAMWDQGCVSFLINSKYKKYTKILAHKLQGDSLLNHPDFKYDENVNFINHICGGKNDKIKEGFLLIKSNKWWKTIL